MRAGAPAHASRTPLWSDDPLVLIRAPLQLWPSAARSRTENANAVARLAICAGLALAAALRKPLLLIPLAAILLVARLSMRTSAARAARRPGDAVVAADLHDALHCHAPSVANPMANPLPTDFGSGRPKLPACSADVPGVDAQIDRAMRAQAITRDVYELMPAADTNAKLATRTFFSVPASGVPDARHSFVHAVHGSNIDRSYHLPARF